MGLAFCRIALILKSMTRKKRPKSKIELPVVTFKASRPNQMLLFPPALGDLIDANHPARVVADVVDRMDVSVLMKNYKGGGSSSYHLKMLLKVLIYGYLCNIYSSRRLEAAVKVESEIIRNGNKTNQNRYYLSSRHALASAFNAAVKSHWSIENSQHWVLDVQFDEDRCRKRKDNAAENFAILRRLALNILNHDKTPRLSTNRKRMKASWHENYLIKLLGFLKI